MVKKLRAKGLHYDETDTWRRCEIIVADLNFGHEIIMMMGQERKRIFLEAPPVICVNPTRTKGQKFIENIKCFCDQIGCEPPVFENDDDIVNLIGWFDYFLPRIPLLTPEAREMMARAVQANVMKPEKE